MIASSSIAIPLYSSATETAMKTTHKALLTAVAAIAMGLSASAGADDYRHGHQRWKHPHHHSHGHGHYPDRYANRYYVAPAYIVRERVVIEHPVYVAPPPPYYYVPSYYVPSRRPGVVVNVDIPPFVIPLR